MRVRVVPVSNPLGEIKLQRLKMLQEWLDQSEISLSSDTRARDKCCRLELFVTSTCSNCHSSAMRMRNVFHYGDLSEPYFPLRQVTPSVLSIHPEGESWYSLNAGLNLV